MRIILASPEAKVWSARKHIPLGLGYLAAVLREAGHDVIIFDAAVEDVDLTYYLDQAEEEGRPYQLIGITATTPLIQEAWEMAQLCKARGLTTVLGGPHLTIMPLESLQPPHHGTWTTSSRGRASTASWSWSTPWRPAACRTCCRASTSAEGTRSWPAPRAP